MWILKKTEFLSTTMEMTAPKEEALLKWHCTDSHSGEDIF